ncbi:MAG: hypothetical protein KQJ78_12475 [Deltaproteobacteria bacterium]|nr:hypothetical protein [Deltaproteobacteria bacterium]
MTEPRVFGQQEFSLLNEALWVAEDSVSDYFRVSEGFWSRHPYELRTLAQLQGGEVSPVALAQILKLRRNQGPGELRGKDFFRICLQDHNFLEVINREADQGLFLPLLTYVLTHELVHVIRFGKFHQLFEADQALREREEAHVSKLCAQVLGRVKMPQLDRVLGFYEQYGHGRAARA